ncbi:MAG: HAD family phosphatase [Halioglobus sp.]|nr:HAD family phosphatase [Halioglobus sp.]
MTQARGKRYILWDHDGVLVDTEQWYYEATRQKIAELGITLELEDYLERMVDGLSSWDLAIAAGTSEAAAREKRLERDVLYREFLLTQDIEIPGVIDILSRLSEHFSMAIVTTSKGADFEVIHAERNIVNYMDFTLVREDYAQSKPNPEPYLLALQRFGATADECLVIEDSQRGLKAAVAAGIDCAVVYNNFTARQDFSAATYRLDSLADLPGLLGIAGQSEGQAQ